MGDGHELFHAKLLNYVRVIWNANTIAAVVARAAHRIPDAALPALLALETDTARLEAKLLSTAFLITLTD